MQKKVKRPIFPWSPEDQRHDRRPVSDGPRPDLSTVEKRNAFYSSDRYRNMTTAEKCAVQGDGFINDYD